MKCNCHIFWHYSNKTKYAIIFVYIYLLTFLLKMTNIQISSCSFLLFYCWEGNIWKRECLYWGDDLSCGKLILFSSCLFQILFPSLHLFQWIYLNIHRKSLSFIFWTAFPTSQFPTQPQFALYLKNHYNLLFPLGQ